MILSERKRDLVKKIGENFTFKRSIRKDNEKRTDSNINKENMKTLY